MTPSSPGVPAVGLQLYTMRSVSGPLDDLLARVAALGYDGVETVGTQGVSASELRGALARHAVRFASAHVALRTLRGDLPLTLETYAAAGAEMIVVPWLDPADRPASRSGWEELGREMAGWGASASAAGLSLAYHHHGFELDASMGVTPLEVLLEVADPDHLALELDVGWLVHAGQDPVAWIDRVGARCARLHAKDLRPGPYAEGDAPWEDVGDGVVDWPAVVAAAERAGTPWLLVEHDTPADPWRSAERSLAALRRTLAR
jgi:sugar phosphate isomerase/epimerase